MGIINYGTFKGYQSLFQMHSLFARFPHFGTAKSSLLHEVLVITNSSVGGVEKYHGAINHFFSLDSGECYQFTAMFRPKWALFQKNWDHSLCNIKDFNNEISGKTKNKQKKNWGSSIFNNYHKTMQRHPATHCVGQSVMCKNMFLVDYLVCDVNHVILFTSQSSRWSIKWWLP